MGAAEFNSRSTQGITIEARSFYLPEHSDRRAPRFVFGYRITIRNDSADPVKLLWRRWLITDGAGKQHEVQGAGVVGEQPRLEPGAAFEYQSFCPLPTPLGQMEGAMTMQRDDGSMFEAAVGPFLLSAESEDE